MNKAETKRYREQVDAAIKAIVNTTHTLRGTVSCPKCRGRIEWRYTDDGINYFCLSRGCIYSSDAVERRVMEVEAEVKAPTVITERRAMILMTPEHAEHKAHEMKREMHTQAMHDLADGCDRDGQETAEWITKSERDRRELEQQTLSSMHTSKVRFGPVIEKEVRGQFFQVRRVWFKGRKTQLWMNRDAYEHDRRLVDIHGPWPALIYPDHLEDSVSVGLLERPI